MIHPIENAIETSFENHEDMSFEFDNIIDIDLFSPAVSDAEMMQQIDLDEDIGLFISNAFDSDSVVACEEMMDSTCVEKTERIDAESSKAIQITRIKNREREWTCEKQPSLMSESPQKRYRSSPYTICHVEPARELQNTHDPEKALLSQNDVATNVSTPQELSQDKLDDLYENRLSQLAIAVKRSAASRMQVVRHRLLLSYIGL